MLEKLNWISQAVTIMTFLVVGGFYFVEHDLKMRYRLLQRDLVIHSLQHPEETAGREKIVIRHKLLKRDFNYIKMVRIASFWVGVVALVVFGVTEYLT